MVNFKLHLASGCRIPANKRGVLMRQSDIVIAGGGLAGSLAAAMLARDGYDVVLVDPHALYPPELRCEKLDGTQTEILRRTGLADSVLRAGTYDGECWIARFGRVVEKRAGDQHGILYDTLVNTVRAAIPARAAFICGKVMRIDNGPDLQTVALSTGEQIAARLVVLANGLNIGLRHSLGMPREMVSPCHSITLAFDLQPVGRKAFDFSALTYYGERASDRIAYITLFPIGSVMRANFMVYRDMNDPWLRDMRQRPTLTMFSAMPGLRRITGRAEVAGPVKIRPADLCLTSNYLQPGVVLVGDAFSTSCPAAGTGTSKVFTDVERLCNVHVPRWFATGGMGADKIAAFYGDPEKQSCDRHSLDKAFRLRSLSIDTGLRWRALRWVRFLGRLAIGSVRKAAVPLPPRPVAQHEAAATDRAAA